MPIYEYCCEECGHEMEAMQKISDSALTECPACGKPALKKMLSAPGFRLKGGGWYETDFKGGNTKNVAESGSAESSKPATGHSCGGKCACN
ncbi:MAG: FmdB family zinc ribbon protein [Pseudomonadota bacterium]